MCAGAVADDSLAIRAALSDCGGSSGGEIILRGPGVYDALPMNLTSNQVLNVSRCRRDTASANPCQGPVPQLVLHLSV